MKSNMRFGIMFLGICLLAGATLLKYSSFTHSTATDISITNPPSIQVPPAPNTFPIAISAEDFAKEASIMRPVQVKTGGA
jgi:hypothetical protein